MNEINLDETTNKFSTTRKTATPGKRTTPTTSNKPRRIYRALVGLHVEEEGHHQLRQRALEVPPPHQQALFWGRGEKAMGQPVNESNRRAVGRFRMINAAVRT